MYRQQNPKKSEINASSSDRCFIICQKKKNKNLNKIIIYNFKLMSEDVQFGSSNNIHLFPQNFFF